MNDTDTLIILSTIVILAVVSIMFVVYAFFIKKKSELLYKQKLKETFLENELANSQIEIREQTLNYIGQELHDDLGQKLTVAKLMIGGMLQSENPEKAESLAEINALLGESIQDIRNLSKTFITDTVMHFGLIESIEQEVRRIRKLKLINVEFKTNRTNLDINSKHSLILFRIIQETINNSLKHSNAKNLYLDVSDSPAHLEIMIKDDGKGFDQNSFKAEGSGLSNVSNRAHLINATCGIKSEIGTGTSVLIDYKKIP